MRHLQRSLCCFMLALTLATFTVQWVMAAPGLSEPNGLLDVKVKEPFTPNPACVNEKVKASFGLLFTTNTQREEAQRLGIQEQTLTVRLGKEGGTLASVRLVGFVPIAGTKEEKPFDHTFDKLQPGKTQSVPGLGLSATLNNAGDELKIVGGDKSPTIVCVEVEGKFQTLGKKEILLHASITPKTAKKPAIGEAAVQGTISQPSMIHFTQLFYETSQSSLTAKVVVERSGDISHLASVDYTTKDITTVIGIEYTRTRGTLIFEPGEQFKEIRIPLESSPAFINTVSLIVSLRNPRCAEFCFPSSAIVQISGTGTYPAVNPGWDTRDAIYSPFLSATFPALLALGQPGPAQAPPTGGLFIGGKRVDKTNPDFAKIEKALTQPTEKTENEAAIRREVFDKTTNFPNEKFDFPNLAAAEDNFKMRLHVIDSMRRITNPKHQNRIDLTFGEPPQANKTYWEFTMEEYTYTLQKGKQPFEAITKGLEQSKTVTECLTTSQAAVLLGAAQVLKENRFNKVHGNELVLSGFPAKIADSSALKKHMYKPPRLVEITIEVDKIKKEIANLMTKLTPENQKKAQELQKKAVELANEGAQFARNENFWIPGDVLTMANVFPAYEVIYPKGAWQNENVVYIGKDEKGLPRFSGLGVDAVSQAGLKALLILVLEEDKAGVMKYQNDILAKNSGVIKFAEEEKITV